MLFKSITTVTCMTVYYLDLIPIFPLKLSDFKLCQLGSLCHIQQSAPETQVFVNRQTVDFKVRFKHYHIANLTAPATQVSIRLKYLDLWFGFLGHYNINATEIQVITTVISS